MTIRRKLQISNILMLVIPVVVMAAAGLLCFKLKDNHYFDAVEDILEYDGGAYYAQSLCFSYWQDFEENPDKAAADLQVDLAAMGFHLRMRLRLKEATRARLEYENYRRELLTVISHDLRTPLTSIKGYADGLLEGIADTEEKRQRYYRAIRTRAGDMEALADSLSSFSRLENRKLNLSAQPCRLSDFLGDLLEGYAVEAEKKGILFINDVPRDEVWLRLDEAEMKRVFINLFENSAKYRSRSQSVIHLSRRCDGTMVEIRVADDGPGVPEEDPLIVELERDYLEVSSYEVEIAADGFAGMKLCREKDYDLVLLDVMLPGVSGFEICRDIRKTKDIPVIMVTAKKEDIDKIRGLGLGADDYVVKPFSPAELVARVRAHIGINERLLKNSEGVRRQQAEIQVRDLRLNRDSHRVYLKDQEIPLTNKEFELLLFLAENPNIVFSKDTLFDRIWGMDVLGDAATVTVHVNRLREKIEKGKDQPEYIETVWGVGYRFRGGE